MPLSLLTSNFVFVNLLHTRKFLAILFVASILVACKGSSREKKSSKEKEPVKTEETHQKPPSSSHDTLIINSASAVFYKPDSAQLASRKATVPNNVYESEVHNCYYQMRNARIVIKKYYPAIHIIETSSARFLLFIKKNKRNICIDLDTKGDMCGIFLFNQTKDPELIDMMNIDTALRFYFEK